MKFLSFLLFTCSILLVHGEDEDRKGEDTFVTIQNGTMKGKTAPTALGSGIMYAYTRIPFAAPPVGDLRFKAPETALGWGDEILDATQVSTGCPQHLTSANPSEDCLFLNVYSKINTTDGPLLPVMVFIFGGGFIFGDNHYYTGAKLLANDIVFVVPNYRVGIFGFLSTEDEQSPGNYGLKDQQLALRWVQENIEAFGGDPDRVTLFGESAGGASALYHLIAPSSQGLFHQMIVQSGSPMCAWAQDRHPLQSAKEFAGRVGCPNDTSVNIVTCLREKPAEELSEAMFYWALDVVSRLETELPGTTPVVEPNIPGAMITEDPYFLLKDGPLPDIPIILGTVKTEGSFVLGGFYYLKYANSTLLNDADYMRDRLIPDLLTSFHIDEPAITETIALTFMPGNLRDNFTDIMPDLNDMLSVFFNKAQVMRTADILSRRLTNVYLYSFEYETKSSLWNILWPFVASILGGEKPPVDGGIMHADDLVFMFNFPVISTPADAAFSKVFNQLWTNFAATANPTPTDQYVPWPKYSVETQQYYRLKATPSVGTDFRTSWRRPYE